jgi:hypothetical protein
MKSKYDISEASEILKDNGFELICDNYKNKSSMVFVKKDNYILRTSLKMIINGRTSPIVNKNNPYSIQNLNTFIKEIFPLLSIPNQEYKNTMSKIKVLCEKHGEMECLVGNLLSGHGCKKCGYEKNVESQKFSIKKAKEFYINKGLTPLFDEYIGVDHRHLFETENGYKAMMSISDIKRGQHYYVFSKANPYTIYNIKKWIKDNNKQYDLLSDDYIDAYSKLTLVCKEDGCKNIWDSYWSNMSSGAGCPKCGIRASTDKSRLTIEDVKYRMTNINKNIIITDERYVDAKTRLKCYCKKCKKDFYLEWAKLSNGRGCQLCSKERMSGSNHPMWNENLTDDDRVLRRTKKDENGLNHSLWRLEIFEKYKYKCYLSNRKGSLNAHHLNSYHWDVENRFNVDNGICILKSLHKLFHKLYGSKNNTKEQFKEFTIRYNIGEFGFDFK